MEITGKVMLDNTETWELYADEMADIYDIRVSLPHTAVPESGYPIIYVLDGNSYFQIARDVVRLQSRNAPKTFVDDAIIVGIGHPGEPDKVKTRRFYEFTAPAESYVYPERLNKFHMEDREHGGANRFLDFIELQLKPEIERRYPVDQERQTLFGHSLSGLFTLWALFTKPNMFQSYLAVSPSIWWNEYEILTYMDRFLNQLGVEERKRLLIAVGAREGFMVDDAKVMLDRLLESQQTKVLCNSYIAPDENHASIVPTVMSRAMRFATNK